MCLTIFLLLFLRLSCDSHHKKIILYKDIYSTMQNLAQDLPNAYTLEERGDLGAFILTVNEHAVGVEMYE